MAVFTFANILETSVYTMHFNGRIYSGNSVMDFRNNRDKCNENLFTLPNNPLVIGGWQKNCSGIFTCW